MLLDKKVWTLIIQHTAMHTDISYNNVKDEIVKILTSRIDLDKYIVNTSDKLPVSRIFSRKSKFPIEDMLAFMIMPRTESTAVELAEFAELTGKDPVCKQTFFMKRRQIKDSLFDEINHRCVNDMYTAESVGQMSNGLYLFAFDGTTLNLPDTPDIVAKFPKGSNQKGDFRYPQARMEVLKDVLNGTVVDIQVDTTSVSEPTLAIRSMKTLPRDLVDRSLFVYDRGYIGAGWFTWLALNDIQYVVRLPRGFNKEVDSFFASDESAADVLVEMSAGNWERKGKKSFENIGLDPDNCPPVLLHLVKCRLNTGETEVLAVRMWEGSPSCEDAYRLYGNRWGVETTIDEFKNQLQLEIFSGNSVLCVMQDIKSKIIAYNIGVSIARRATDSLEDSRDLSETTEGERVRVKVNLNVGWHYLKHSIPIMLLCEAEKTEKILTQTLKNIKRNVEMYVLDRHLPHGTKTRTYKGKYITFTNYKRAI